MRRSRRRSRPGRTPCWMDARGVFARRRARRLGRRGDDLGRRCAGRSIRPRPRGPARRSGSGGPVSGDEQNGLDNLSCGAPARRRHSHGREELAQFAPAGAALRLGGAARAGTGPLRRGRPRRLAEERQFAILRTLQGCARRRARSAAQTRPRGRRSDLRPAAGARTDREGAALARASSATCAAA